MRRICGLLVVAVFGAIAGVGEAQVDIGPGYIRAPYVRIYRDPWGGKRVQTPFVDVYRPGRYGPPPEMRREMLSPTRVAPDVYASESWDSNLPPLERSRRQLAVAAREFRRSLSRFDTADTWLTYFALDEGGTLSPERLAALSGPATPDLAAMLARFESINGDARYPMIAELPSFRQTYERLAQYLAASVESAAESAEELPVPQPDPPQRTDTLVR